MIPASLGLLRGWGDEGGPGGRDPDGRRLCAADALGLEGDVSIATTRYIVEDRNATSSRRWRPSEKLVHGGPGARSVQEPPLSCYPGGAPRRGSGPAEPSWRPASGASPNRDRGGGGQGPSDGECPSPAGPEGRSGGKPGDNPVLPPQSYLSIAGRRGLGQFAWIKISDASSSRTPGSSCPCSLF